MARNPLKVVCMQTGLPGKPALVVYDTDLHGMTAGLIAVKSLREAGLEVARHYSNFAPAPPATTPNAFADTLPQLAAPGTVSLYVLDIPVNVQDPLKFINAVTAYTFGGGRVMFIDHHGHSQHVAHLFGAGVNVILQPTSFDMSLYIPRVLNNVDRDKEMYALIGAISDFDVSVTGRVSPSLEEDVTEYLDVAFKQKLQKLPEVAQHAPRYGNIGALVEYLIERNVSAEELLEMGREHGQPVPLLKHEVRGEVVYAVEMPPPGLAWKCAAKLSRYTSAPLAVVYTEAVRGNVRGGSLIATAYWRRPEYAPIVDAAVERIAAGRPVAGHTGAKSIFCTSVDEARSLLPQLVAALNEEAGRVWKPRVTHLVSDERVASAIHEDYRAILRALTEILGEMRSMYKEYLDLKRRQVEALEREGRRSRATD
ncbi:MAG: hypothetical protein QXU64_01170 [Thermofilaceae archaeon]